MLKTAIISVSTLAFASVAAVTIATTIRDASYHVDPYQDWQLTMEYKGDLFILDHDITLTDCMDSLPKSQVTKGVIFDCKRPE